MTEVLYWFNPENDMALAVNDAYYMSPASTRQMAADLSVLPMWYAEERADVLVDGRATDFLQQCAIKTKVRLVTEWSTIYNKVYPWGWNPALLRRLREAGLPDSAYPSQEIMKRIRELSSRQTAVELLAHITIPREPLLFCGESSLLYTLKEVEQYVLSHSKAVLKSPWSGSGRGIQHTSGEFPLPLKGWVEHVLHTQQAIVGEPFYNKVHDFAMEFYATSSGDVRFVGYSFFETDIRGIYKENLLASDIEIEKRLAFYVSQSSLHELRRQLSILLKEKLHGDYQGYLGVDMMICRVGDTHAIHPCVEVNLRMNMGVVSRLVYDRHICSGSQGRYVIEFYRNPGEAEQMHHALQQQNPLTLEDGRVKQGYLSLTPVNEKTAYQAYIIVRADR